jgi:hypothetical protein
MITNESFLLKTVALCRSKNFQIRNTDGFLNIVGVRNSSKRSDKWDDYIVAFRWMNKKFEGYAFEGTTDAGAYYLLNPMRAAGTAILVPDVQVLDHYRLQDNGHNGYRAYRQIKPFPYIRDNNRDTLLNFELFEDKSKWITNERIGSNLHRASSNIIVNAIGKYSAGCQVIRKPKDFEKLVWLGNEQIRITGIDTFHYGIIWLDEILNVKIAA